MFSFLTDHFGEMTHVKSDPLDVLLFVVGVRFAQLAHSDNTRFTSLLQNRNFTIQLGSEEEGIARYFIINNGKFSQHGGEATDPTLTITFKDSMTGVKLLTKADAAAFMSGIQQGDVKMTGDYSLLMWFNQVAKYIVPHVPEALEPVVDKVKPLIEKATPVAMSVCGKVMSVFKPESGRGHRDSHHVMRPKTSKYFKDADDAQQTTYGVDVNNPKTETPVRGDARIDDSKVRISGAADDHDESEGVIDNIKAKVSEVTDTLHDKLDELGGEAKEKFAEVKDDVQQRLNDVKDKATDLKEQAQDKFDDVKHKAEDKIDEAKDKAADLKDKVETKAEEIKDKADDKAGELKDKATDLKHQAETKVDDVKHQAEDKIDEAKDKAANLKEQAQDKFDDVKHQAEDKIDEAKDKAADLKEQAQDKFDDVKHQAEDKIDEAKDKAADLKDKAETKAEEIKDTADSKAGELKDKATDLKHQAEAKVDDVKHKAEDKIDEAKDKAADLKDKVETKADEVKDQASALKNKASSNQDHDQVVEQAKTGMGLGMPSNKPTVTTLSNATNNAQEDAQTDDSNSGVRTIEDIQAERQDSATTETKAAQTTHELERKHENDEMIAENIMTSAVKNNESPITGISVTKTSSKDKE
ncbi:hypothetical protein ACF3NV_02295 [Moraxella atlantae]|uniref:hypothetical protein n=1 Tax=Faucicola atlantae TaxID=34059 RepID=UPI003752A7E3